MSSQPTGVPRKRDGDEVGVGRKQGLSRFPHPTGKEDITKEKGFLQNFIGDFWKLGDLGAQSTPCWEPDQMCPRAAQTYTTDTERAVLPQLLAQRPLSAGQQDEGQLDASLAAET